MATLEDFQIPSNFDQKGGFATEQTLLEVRDALSKTNRVEQDGIGKFNKSTKDSAKDIKVFGTTIGKMNPALAALETGFNILGSAITGATGLVKSIASADGSFESLGGVVDFAADQISNTFGRLPIIGNFIEASARATAEITKLRLAFMDLQKETFQGLAASGFRLDRSLGNIISTVLEANISVDQFGRLATQNADGLRVFGGTFGNATEEFTKRIERLTNEDSQLGMGLRLLGLGSNEIAEEFADFIQTNRNNSRLLSMDEQELNKQLQDRIKSERVIAEITGISAQEQRQQQMQLAGEAAFQAALMSFPAEQRDVLTTFVSGLKGPAQDAAKQLLAFGTITDEQTALLSSAAPGLLTAIENEIGAIRGGARDADASIAKILSVGAASADQLAELTKLGFLDPSFNAALSEFFLQITRSQAQLQTLNEAQDKFGRTFADQEELVGYINDEYKKQFDLAKTLAAEGKLTVEALTASGEIDKETAKIIQQAAEVEDAVGSFQSQIFKTLTDNFTGLTDVTVALTDVFGDLLEAAGVSKADVAAMQTDYTATGERKGMGGDPIYVDEEGNKFSFNRFRGFEPMALGGAFGSNTLSMVGERGPELVRFGQLGEVINNRTTSDIMSAASGIVDAMASPATTANTTPQPQNIVQPANMVNNNISDDILKQITDILNQSNTIQSNILKETRRGKGFQY